jgi:ubiquinone/menaquinone biosynthesis C-methylase UbiE
MNSQLEYWNKDAANYDNRAKKSYKAYQRVIELIKNEVKKDMSFLDIGTGTGEIPLALSLHVKKIEGIDYSPEMITIAKKKIEQKMIKNINFSVQDSANLNFSNNSFDIVLISNLLHIIPAPEKVIEEAKRLIKKDGIIILANYLHDENILSHLISFIMKKKGHPIAIKYNSETFSKFIEACSLKIIYKEKIPNLMPFLYIKAIKK